MQPRIETFPQKTFVGIRMTMSFADNKTFEIWRSFIPRRKEIAATIGTELYSMEVYPPDYFAPFDPTKQFEKWAAVEVSDLDGIPEGMQKITAGGLYAVFLHKGPASDGPLTYRYIYGTWLPQSGYTLDARPHLAVMGEKYKKDGADSEEELWIPVRPK